MSISNYEYTPAYPKSTQQSVVLRRADGGFCAYIRKDGAGRLYSIKYVEGSKHMLRTPPAWSFDVASLKEAKRLGIQYHCIVDREADRGYSAWHEDIENLGFDVFRFKAPQRALALGLWTLGLVPKPKETSLFGDEEVAA